MKLSSLILSILLLSSFSSTIHAQTSPIPDQSEWTEIATGIEEGQFGEWDYYFNGAFANSLIKLGDTYYHYYQGAAFYDYDSESNAYRQIGVATSNDLINWTKSPANPVITWLTEEGIDASNVEEGAVSTAPLILDGTLHMYYGANTHLSEFNINSDGRLTTSTNGIDFSDQGSVISGLDNTRWGWGDEVFPLGAYTHEGITYVFYVPNGVSVRHKLGVAYGSDPTELPSSSAVRDTTGALVPAWGPVSPVILPSGESYLFVNGDFDPWPNRDLYIYRFEAHNPQQLELTTAYDLDPDDCSSPAVMYDATKGWIMMCRQKFINTDGVEKLRYSIRTAEDAQPSLSPDPPPPSSPNYADYIDLIKQFATNAASIFDLNSLIRSILN